MNCPRVAVPVLGAVVSLACLLGASTSVTTYAVGIGTVTSYQKISDVEGGFTGILDNDDRFGGSVTSLGDLDGDGVIDIAIGAWGDDDGGGYRGAVWVLFLNVDGTVKTHQKISATEGGFTGPLHYENVFGWSLAFLGDLDGDGVGDLAVGARGDDDGGDRRGAVFVLFLDTDGTVKSHQKISDTQGGFTGVLDDWDWFGWSVASLGDLDGDGAIDLCVGAPFDDDGGADIGALWVLFSNSDGTVKSQQKISATAGGFSGALDANDRFGNSLTALGDLDGDGVVDLATGAFRDDDGGGDVGAAWLLFLNNDGTVKAQQKISATAGGFSGALQGNDWFGESTAWVGDIDGDGMGELAVGASGDDDGGSGRGAVWMLSLAGPGATPPGGDIVVTPVDPATGESPVTITFDNVVVGGVTELEITEHGPAPPAGYKLGTKDQGGPAVYLELSTTAAYEDSVTVCVDYSDLAFGDSTFHKEANIGIFRWDGAQWVDGTSMLDMDQDVVCGRLGSLSTFAVLEAVSYGVVNGVVVADCPVPGTPLYGVIVDVYELGTGDLAASTQTGEDGTYATTSLAAGHYVVGIVTPSGYDVIADEVAATVYGDDVVSVDFSLSCLQITAAPRGIGFWKHQVGAALSGMGHAEVDAETLCSYLDLIDLHFNSNAVNEVAIYEPPLSDLCEDKLEVAKLLLNLTGNTGMTARAKQQVMALLLNVAAQKLGLREVISADGATVSQAITFCDGLLDDPNGDHEMAKTVADWINNAAMVPAGIIPLDTDDIAYSPSRDKEGTPERFALVASRPNPFHASTVMGYQVPANGGHVTLRIYDIAGRLVRTLVDEESSPGQHAVTWDGRDDRGRLVSSGIYFYQFKAKEFEKTRKVLLVK